MENKKFKVFMVVLSVLVAGAISMSAVTGQWYIGAIVLLIAVFKIYQVKMRLKTKVVIEDEMIEKISGKAARITYLIFGLAGALLVLVFFALGQNNPVFYIVGNTLAFAVCAVVAVYVIAYVYLTKDFRGDGDEE